MERCVSSRRANIPAFRCRSVAAAGDSLFFCFAKSKVSKRKGDPTVCVPSLRYGQPAVLGPAGVELKLASLKQSLALIRLDLRSSAHTEGFCGVGFGFEIGLFGGSCYFFYIWCCAGVAGCAVEGDASDPTPMSSTVPSIGFVPFWNAIHHWL